MILMVRMLIVGAAGIGGWACGFVVNERGWAINLLDLAIFANFFFADLVPIIRMENPFNVPMH